jgi:serine protease Do
MKVPRTTGLCSLLLLAVSTTHAQDRATKVRTDRDQLAQSDIWTYNDLDLGIAEAKKTKKPLLVVLRCIPCEACSKFDKKLTLERNNEVHDLLDKFVCVRIVQANNLDLSLFQFDYDQSFHAIFLNPDRTIYGRFGTRSAREEDEDMTMQGLRAAMLAVLNMHDNYPANRASLAGKQGHPVEYRVPEELPSLKGKYTDKLNYEGNVVASCIHCHQVRDSERALFRTARKPMPEHVVFPYPLPDVLGLKMDGDRAATIEAVEPGSIAARAGLKPNDEIVTLAGQSLISTADLQWVLHHAGTSDELPAVVKRGDEQLKVALKLTKGWRSESDISFRPTTWELRRMATGGLVFEELKADERERRKLTNDRLALVIKHVGQYGEHAAGKNAGFQQGDILIAVEGRTQHQTESQLIASLIDQPPGEKIRMKVLRGDKELDLTLPMQ